MHVYKMYVSVLTWIADVTGESNCIYRIICTEIRTSLVKDVIWIEFLVEGSNGGTLSEP